MAAIGGFPGQDNSHELRTYQLSVGGVEVASGLTTNDGRTFESADGRTRVVLGPEYEFGSDGHLQPRTPLDGA